MHVGIIGSGIAGLTVAYRRLERGDRVSVFEGSPRLGGQLHSERGDGYLIEHGAEGFVAGSQAMLELSRALGIAQHLVDQSVTDSCRFDGQRLLRLDPGEAGRLLGFQVAPRALGKGIQSFVSGMSEVVDVLEQSLRGRARLMLGRPIADVRRRSDGAGWSLLHVDGTEDHVDRVVVATGADAAARLLRGTFGEAAAALASSSALDSVTVSLAFARQAIAHPLDATGFVVSDEAALEGFRACTFASSKLSGRAPADHALLRLFFRPSPDDLVHASDADWSARAERCARRALELRAGPLRSWVSRWSRALPVFDAAHRERVQALESGLAGSGISLAGAAFHGSGIDGAVRSAEAAAQALP